MTQLILRLRVKDFAFYIAILFIATATWQGQRYMYAAGEREIVTANGGIAGEVVTDCSGIEKQQIDAYLEINRLLTTLGTTLLGAVFFLMFNSGRTLKFAV
jgi:hypothetical protein